MAIFVQDTLHMAERGSYYEGSVKIDGDFLVPPRTEFWKDIVVSGNIYLCPESHVKGNVTCKGGVICRGCSHLRRSIGSPDYQYRRCVPAKGCNLF